MHTTLHSCPLSWLRRYDASKMFHYCEVMGIPIDVALKTLVTIASMISPEYYANPKPNPITAEIYDSMLDTIGYLLDRYDGVLDIHDNDILQLITNGFINMAFTIRQFIPTAGENIHFAHYNEHSEVLYIATKQAQTC